MLYKFLVAASVCGFGSALLTQYGSSSPEQFKELFQAFKTKYRKNYATMDEEVAKFQVFVEHLKVIDHRNEIEKSSGGSAIHGITKFADMTQEEFESLLDIRVPHNMRNMNATAVEIKPYSGSLSSVDYAGKQTTAIKDQGSCGSCWAHAAAEQIESDGMRLLGNPASKTLSVQQLVSCDNGKGQNGCMGGLQEPAFDYVRLNGGIVSAADYPYKARTGQCDTSKNHYIMGVTGYSFILDSTPDQTESSFTSYMLSSGTISIGADATTWNTYVSGVMSNCGKGTDINHAVQLVGVSTGADGYWKIRNSWAADWGEQGYIRLAYGKNTCSLATEGGSYTTVFNI